MGNVPTQTTLATEHLARLGVAASRLGIETYWLEVAGQRFGDAAGPFLRVWLDTDMPRLAIRCIDDGALTQRPSRVRYTELDSVGGEYELAAGSRAFEADRELITGVPTRGLDDLQHRLDTLAAGRCDALGRFTDGIWTAEITVSEPEDLPASTAMIGRAAGELGVPPLQRTLLEQAHGELGMNGYAVRFACDGTGMRREITLEYRRIAWPKVIGLTDALRPPTSSGTALGVFAGAFFAEQASGIAITYRDGQPALVRIAIDCS